MQWCFLSDGTIDSKHQLGLNFAFQAFSLYGDVFLLLGSVFMEPGLGIEERTAVIYIF